MKSKKMKKNIMFPIKRKGVSYEYKKYKTNHSTMESNKIIRPPKNRNYKTI
jgi:ribosomal protein S17